MAAGQTIAVFETDRAGGPSEAGQAAATPQQSRADPPRCARILRLPGTEVLLRAIAKRGGARGPAADSARHSPARPGPADEGEQADHPPLLSPDVGHAEAMAARRTAVAGKPIAWDAFFVHAAGKALRRFERLCCRFEDDRLVPQGVDAVGLAVDLEDDLSPWPSNVPRTGRPSRSPDEIAEGVARLRSGDPAARLRGQANLTISNLGGSGIESFAAVINPPESAILAVGKVMPVVTVVDGQVAVQNRVNLTLSVDHRVASGKYAARFLGAIVQELESL